MSKDCTLALDCAAKTGWAVGSRSGAIHGCGLWKRSHKEGDHPGQRFIDFRQSLYEALDIFGADRVVYEIPMGNFKSFAAGHSIHGYIAQVEMACAERGIPVSTIPQPTLKKYATGSGNAKKGKMLAAARRKWPKLKIVDDNVADALWLLDMTISTKKLLF